MKTWYSAAAKIQMDRDRDNNFCALPVPPILHIVYSSWIQSEIPVKKELKEESSQN